MARHPTDDNENLPKLDEYPGLSEAMLDTVQLPLLVLNGGLRLIRANAAFFSHFKVSTNDSIGRRLPELGNGQWNIPDLLHLLENVLPQGEAVENYRVEHDFPTLGPRIMHLNARRITAGAINHDFAVLASPDATDGEKLAALKFLGHWVGDIHQPLHAASQDDRGGNHIRRSAESGASIGIPPGCKWQAVSQVRLRAVASNLIS